jgi:hypothetical protein
MCRESLLIIYKMMAEVGYLKWSTKLGEKSG